MKPGEIVVCGKICADNLIRFCYVSDDMIQNDASWSQRWRCPDKAVILCVKPLDSSDHTVTVTAAAVAAVASSASVATMWAMGATALAAASSEFTKTRKIKGHVFLTPCGRNIWISPYDITELRKL